MKSAALERPRTKRPVVSRQVKEHYYIILGLSALSNEVRKSIMKNASKDFILALMEIVSNVVYGNVDVSSEHVREMKKHAKILQEMANKKTSMRRRKEIIQQGGFLAALAGPILGAVAPLIGGLVKGIFPSRGA